MSIKKNKVQRVTIILRKGKKALRDKRQPDKEVKRFTDIYKTVYRHARHKGQSHKQALDYCWNVYAEQAPPNPRGIIKSIVSEQMSINRSQIRKMIMEALEGEVVSLADYRTPEEPIAPDTEMSETLMYDSFLSEIHTQILDFMEENFETLTSEQQVFLDKMLDKLEKELGIEDEASFDFGEEEEVIADIEDED